MSTTPVWFFQQYTDNNGKPLSNGKIYTYVAGSTNLPKATYYDKDLTILAPNPIILDASGNAPQYFLTSAGAYKFEITDQNNVVIATRDWIYSNGGGTSGTGSDHKVIINSSDTVPGYLSDKIVNSSTVTANISASGSDYKMSFNVVTSGLTGISGTPIGPAGGDLAGTYPDPIVKQLTGLESAMVIVPTNFNGGNNTVGQTGIMAGKRYINGLETKSWSTIDFDGYIQYTLDGTNWTNSVRDTSLHTYAVGHGGNSWNTISFGWMASQNQYAWFAGSGYLKEFQYALHIPTNYNQNGSLKTTAWNSVSYSAIGGTPANVGDMSFGKDNVVCWVGNSTQIGRTVDFNTFQSVLSSGTGNLGGIATDNYGNWMSIERDTGILRKSIDNGLTFPLVPTIFINGVSATSLPGGVMWGSILCSYGVWIAAVYQGTQNGISYAYSTDTLNWTLVYGQATSFFSAASDGIKWFSTNPTPDTPNPIYQLLISEIPAHKRLVCEKGVAIAGNAFLTDMPNINFLGTDTLGKIVSADSSNIGGKVMVNPTDTKEYLFDKVKANEMSGIVVNQQGGPDYYLEIINKGYVGYSEEDTLSFLQNKMKPGAGITITSASDPTYGTQLIINAKGNSWRLTKYITTNYTVLDTDDTLIIRANGVVITMPTPSSAYEGRIITVRCSGGSNSANMTGSIVGSSAVSGTMKLEFMCFANNSGFFWFQQ